MSLLKMSKAHLDYHFFHFPVLRHVVLKMEISTAIRHTKRLAR